MATDSGTATNYLTLLTNLRTFLTTNVDLVAANQNWVVESTAGGGAFESLTYLRGPGLTQTDTIHVNLRAYRDPSDIAYFNWEIRGAVAFDNGEDFDNQPGVSPITNDSLRSGPRMTLVNASMNYWFVANGRRFIVIADANGTWSTMYGGFILPYATPTEMPYPIFIGGNAATETTSSTAGNFTLGGFWDPPGQGTTEEIVPGNNASYFRAINGAWRAIWNYDHSLSQVRTTRDIASVWPYPYMDDENKQVDVIVPNPDASYTLLPCVIYSDQDGGNVFGELEGVFYVTGTPSISPADTFTIGGDTYLAIRSSYRQDPAFDYVAIKLD